MGHYRSNLRDVEFNLFELLSHQPTGTNGPFSDYDDDTTRSILTEVERLATGVLADSLAAGDRSQPEFDPDTASVRLAPEVTKALQAWMDSDWWQLQVPTDLGGNAAPATLAWATAEFVLGANPALWLYASTATVARVVASNGTPRDRRIAEILLARRWTGTMVLTEAEAGSDVGAARAMATLNPDGTWNVTGSKRFITAADHDVAENILHLVLARPSGVEGAGGPGTKGLSLFLVPKFDFDPDTGELTGRRNGAMVTGLERKMGLHASATCEIAFGETEPARGWLLGEVHQGIAQMFDVIEYARMMVGVKAASTLSTAYLNALDHARTRVQGPDLTRAHDASAPRIEIVNHPDVRRSLATQKAYAEGLRSLVLWTASWRDRATVAEHAGHDPKQAQAMNDLLLPVVKGYASERAFAVISSECLQTFGGAGYLLDHPLEQYLRDSKIDTLYEGTTAIQGQDFFFRKVARNGGATLTALLTEIRASCDHLDHRLGDAMAALRTGVDDVAAMAAHLLARAGEGDRQVYLVGLHATRLLMACGDVLLSWLLLRGATVALQALDSDANHPDYEFYSGKVAAALHFTHQVLPHVTAERRIVETGDLNLMDLSPAAL